MHDLGDTLRTLAELGPSLRAAGFLSVQVGSVFVEFAPLAPPVVSAPVAAPDEDDADDELEGEAKELANAERGWNAYWERMTRSSGAPTPPFPGLEKFRLVARGLGVKA